ncbi:unnamed protein product, partial [Meganyctiphanes norvegica]
TQLGSAVSTLTTMNHRTLLRLIIVVVLTDAWCTALNCYVCTDNPDDGSVDYDADCGQYDYRRNTHTSDNDGCGIDIYDNGFTFRAPSGGWADGECYHGTDHTFCNCASSLCNTDSFCAQCGYPRPTPPGTTEYTPIATTVQPETTSTEATTTVLPPHTTTSFSTNTPAKRKCYQCINCGHVEASTPVIEDAFLSCMTTMVLESAEVIRSGSYTEYPDGECVAHTETLSCYCSKDLCNDINIEF